MLVEEVVGYFELLKWRLLWLTEKGNRNIRSEPPVSGPGFESGTFRIKRTVVFIPSTA
jgi:hypothetical protein